MQDPRHGSGHRHVVEGHSPSGITKAVHATFYARYPGMAVLQVEWRNTGAAPLAVLGWRACAHELADAPGGFWSFSGATHEDRRDWVQAMGADFDQRNTLSMAASDYGGGTPVANVWRRDAGLAVGHLEPVPRLLDLPVRKTAGGAAIAVESPRAVALAPAQSLRTDAIFVCAHHGDHFAPLLRYRACYGRPGAGGAGGARIRVRPCGAHGAERDFTIAQVLGTLPKVRELGFEWAVLDDGWQTGEGDWRLDPRKFPAATPTCATSSPRSGARACARGFGWRRSAPIRAATCCTTTSTCCCWTRTDPSRRSAGGTR